MTHVTRVRVLRQLLVLGDAAQARVGTATVVVHAAGFAGDVEALYAERAGFAQVVRATEPVVVTPDDTKTPDRSGVALETDTARELLRGARAAVRAIRLAAEGAGQ